MVQPSPRRHRELIDGKRHITLVELIIVLTIVVAVVAMAVWFVFFSTGGIGPGAV
jgi:cell division protein FtsL